MEHTATCIELGNRKKPETRRRRGRGWGRDGHAGYKSHTFFNKRLYALNLLLEERNDLRCSSVRHMSKFVAPFVNKSLLYPDGIMFPRMHKIKTCYWKMYDMHATDIQFEIKTISHVCPIKKFTHEYIRTPPVHPSLLEIHAVLTHAPMFVCSRSISPMFYMYACILHNPHRHTRAPHHMDMRDAGCAALSFVAPSLME